MYAVLTDILHKNITKVSALCARTDILVVSFITVQDSCSEGQQPRRHVLIYLICVTGRWGPPLVAVLGALVYRLVSTSSNQNVPVCYHVSAFRDVRLLNNVTTPLPVHRRSYHRPARDPVLLFLFRCH